MGTVTEARLTITMAQRGGIGTVRKNLKPEEQTREVAKVERFESGMLCSPITIGPDMKIRDVMALSTQRDISGFLMLEGKEVVGITTNHDLRFEEELDAPVRAKVTPSEKPVAVEESAPLEEAKHLMNKHHPERALVVGETSELRGLVTVKDIQKATEYLLASKDGRSSLRVGAAVGVGPNNDLRIDLLTRVGMSVIVIDTAHGHSQGVLNRVYRIEDNCPQMQVIGGNIVVGDAARALVDHGVDGIKVGIGPGSICTTRIIAGMGMPQIFATPNVTEALEGTGVPLIADGGIRYSGDVAEILATGIHTVMMSDMFAGTDESPDEMLLFQGHSYKSYRNMGSIGATKGGTADRYFQEGNTVNIDKLVPEDIEDHMSYKSSTLPTVHRLADGTHSSMGYYGCTPIAEQHEKAQFVEITAAGVNESHVHDVQITEEAPNYHRD